MGRYRRTLKQWLSTTDVPSEKHGMLLWRALTGDAKLLISHFRDEDLLHWDVGQRIFEVLSQAHKHISEFEDQDDFDNAFYKLHRERNQTLLQFANVARAAYLKHDAYGYPLPDRTKGMIFLRQAKIPGHLEDHIMAKTNGSRNFSDLLDAIQRLVYFDSRNDRYAEVDFQQDGKTFLDVREDDVTFLDVQTDGVTLPVPCSSSSFSLGSVVVVGPRANVCSDMKFESDGGTDDSKPEPLAKSAEMKRLVGIAVANGTPVRVAYKDVRRRMRIEARRQKELDEGAEPEAVLDSFLDQVKVEQQQQNGPLKRVLTPSAKAAKHRRAKDKKWRETMCWWIVHDKVCPHGDQCNFRHTVSETGASSPSPAPEMCETGVSWPSLATEQDKSETRVSSPGQSTNPTHPRSPTRVSWNNSWDRYDWQQLDSWLERVLPRRCLDGRLERAQFWLCVSTQ